jgi:hypothetical protein
MIPAAITFLAVIVISNASLHYWQLYKVHPADCELNSSIHNIIRFKAQKDYLASRLFI